MRTWGRGRRVLPSSQIIVAVWNVAMVSRLFACVIPISRGMNVETKIAEELEVQLVETANKRVPQPASPLGPVI